MGADATGKITAADWQTYGQVQSNIDETKLRSVRHRGRRFRASGGSAPMDGAATTYDRPYRGGCSRRPSRCTAALQVQLPAGAECTAAVLRERADRRRAGTRVNMDPIAFRRPEHRPHERAGARWLSVMDGCDDRGRAGSRRSLRRTSAPATSSRAAASASALAASQVGIVADVSVNKKTGKIVVEAPLHRAEQRRHDRPAARREPDERCGDPGSLPRDVGAGRVQQGAGHEPRLGLVPDPPLQGPPRSRW